MLTKGLLTRFIATAQRANIIKTTQQRLASTTATPSISNVAFDRAILQYNPKNTMTATSVFEHVSHLRPFSVPAPPQPSMTTPSKIVEELEMTSVLRKRRLKMNKHKHKKLRKRTRALRKKLGK